ncbi:MAG TPA: hypothetical protein VGM52_15210 [Herbaspirillum sp.]
MKKLTMLAAFAMLTGCSIGWVRPDGTEGNLDRDRFECQQQMSKTYPPMMMQVQVGGGYVTPSRTKCRSDGPNTNCITYPSVYVPPEWALQDVNEQNRSNGLSACLRSRGYEFHMGFK